MKKIVKVCIVLLALFINSKINAVEYDNTVVNNDGIMDSVSKIDESFYLVDGVYHYYRNGNMVKSEWILKDNNWYYVDNLGNRVENGWFKIGTDWYYFENSIAQSEKWITHLNGNLYYVGSNCNMVKSKWIQNEDKWHYVDGYGRRIENGWKQISNSWSYFDGGIAQVNKWIQEADKNWYYLGDDAYMRKSWFLDYENKWYYANDKGSIQYDTFVNGYYLGFSGAMFDGSDNRFLNVPELSQLKPYYMVMGCEGTSFTMAIKYKGVNNYTQKDINSLFTITGDPRTGFLGNPFSFPFIQGTAPTIWPEALIEHTKDVYSNVENITGADLTRIMTEIDNGNPVVYWYARGKMIPIYTPNGYIQNATEMHCVTLVGYDKDYLYYNDPWTGKLEKTSKSVHYRDYVKYGRRAIVVK